MPVEQEDRPRQDEVGRSGTYKTLEEQTGKLSPAEERFERRRRTVGLFAGPLVLAAMLLQLGGLTRGEKNTLFVLAFALVGWFLPGVVGIVAGDDSDAYVQVGEAANEGIVAILAAAMLFVLPVDWARRRFTLNWNQAANIDWGTVILFGGGITLGTLLSETGLAEKLGTSLSDTFGVSSLFGVTVVIVAVLISETTSNTASAAIVVPIAISIAASADLNPTIPALAAIFGANYGFMLPVSTPPNAIVYSSGLLPIGRMIKAGAVFDLVGIVLCVAGVMVMASVVGLA